MIHPEQQNRVYETVLSHLKIQLPDHPMRYTAMPNALKGEGIWQQVELMKQKLQ